MGIDLLAVGVDRPWRAPSYITPMATDKGTPAVPAKVVVPIPPQQRWWRRLALAAVLAVAALPLYLWWGAHRAEARLAEAVAAADRDDPGWRWDDLMSRRPPVADADNAGLHVLAVRGLYAANAWPGKAFWDKQPESYFTELHNAPTRRLTAEQREFLRTTLPTVAPAVTAAHQLADKPRGRLPIPWQLNYAGTVLPNVQECREVTNLLWLDLLHRLESGDLPGTVTACRALLGNARAVGEEPNLICYLVRVAIRTIALRGVERMLAFGEPIEPALAVLQADLERELAEPLFLLALRGERAGLYRMLEAVADGRLDRKALRDLTLWGLGPWWRSDWTWVNDAQLRLQEYTLGDLTAGRAALLELQNAAVELAKAPLPSQGHLMKQWEARLADQPGLVGAVLTPYGKIWRVERRTQAELRCTIAAVAAERFRLAHGRWPQAWAEVVPRYLAAVPLDPEDGQPLRLKAVPGNLVIYGVGGDGTDDGGHLDRTDWTKPGIDLGVRLFDLPRPPVQ
jgi:hypothetical protein